MTKIGACEEILARVALEPRGRESEEEEVTLRLQTILGQSRSLAVAANELQTRLNALRDELPTPVIEALASVQESIVAALDTYAEGLQSGACESPPPISSNPLEQSFSGASDAVPETIRSAILNATANVILQLTKLPAWGESTTEPTDLALSPDHV